MPAGLKDIARVLNVSAMTVSRAINGHPEVSAEMRRRVLELARELHYRPNVNARSLITRRSMLIGLVVPDISHSFFDEIFAGVQEVARAKGYFVVLSHTDEDPDAELATIHALLERRADGLILASAVPEKHADLLDGLRQVPHVLIDRRFPHWASSCVVCDDEKAGFVATDHLARLGYRRIAHVAGPGVSTARLRILGYRRALRRYKLPARIWPSGFHESDGYAAAGLILAGRPRPDAVFAVNDAVAIGMLERFTELGVRVPADIALVGAGDMRYSALLSVPLTTIRFPKLEIGRTAMEILLDLLEDQTRMRQVTLAPELVVRRSCGAEKGD